MIDFPANPTLSQVFTVAGNSWMWDGVKWVAIGPGPFLPLAGGTMAPGSHLILAADPVQPLEATTKQYTDTQALRDSLPVGGVIIWVADSTFGGSASAPPWNYVVCNGAYYAATDMPLLFNVLQGAYGWDGTNFAVPNLLDQAVVGAGGSWGINAKLGEYNHTTTANEMPAHAHSIADPTHAHSLYDPAHTHGIGDPGHNHGFPDPGHIHGNVMQAATGYYSLAATGALHTAGQTDLRGTGRTIQAAGVGVWTGAAGTSMGVYGAGTGIGIYNAGGGAAHNNIQPSTAMYYIIRYA